MTEPTTEGIQPADTPEAELSNALDSSEEQAPQDETVHGGGQLDKEPDTFPREVVERLRQENGRYRQRAQTADQLSQRLHLELVKATGRLADPTDLAFDETHLDDPDALAAAVDALLVSKPHLASRRPVGDIGQGNRGAAAESFSLLGMLKERT